MKKVLFAAIVMIAMTSCETRVAGDTSTDHKAVADHHAEATNKVYRAIESGDIAALDTLFTDDVIDHNAGPQGQDIKGKDSVIAMVGQIHNYFEGLKMEMLHHATSADGQYHYATVRMTGKSKANPWGMPVGMDMDDTSVDVVKIRDGKCAEHWSFMSMGDFNEVMSMMQSGGQPPAKADTSNKK